MTTTDDRLFALFEGYERHAEPRPEFLAQLERELRRHAGLERPSLGWRLRALGDRVAPRVGPPARVAWLVAVVALLATLAAVAATVGARFVAPPSPAELVAWSQGVAADPPAFEMDAALTVICPAFVRPPGDAGDACTVRISFDGGRRVRIDGLAGSDGQSGFSGHRLTDGEREAWYGHLEFGARTWYERQLVPELAAIHASAPLFATEPGWLAGRSIDARGTLPWPTCPAGWAGDEPVELAGRAADPVTCGDETWWIDHATGLVLAHRLGDRTWGTVLRLDLDPAFPADRFAFAPPPGALVIDPEAPRRGPAVGSTLPALRLPLLDGGALDTAALAGSPTILYLWAPWCAPCTADTATAIVEAAARHGDAVRFVTLATDEVRAVQRGRAAVGDLPVAVDAEGTTHREWQLEAIPALVALDADGRVAAVRVGPVSPAELDAIVAALVAGEPVPAPAPTASPAP